MKKFLLATAAIALSSSPAFAGSFSGALQDFGADELTWSGSSPNNDLDEAAGTVSAKFVLKGKVEKVCVIGGVDIPGAADGGAGNLGVATIDFGTIGIRATDDTDKDDQFDMTGPANVSIKTTTAGCNYNNSVTLSKLNGAAGMKNNTGSGYDSSDFQTNLPYSVEAFFEAGGTGSTGDATYGSRLVMTTLDPSKSANFGAWRSNMELKIDVPVAAKGLVGGLYEDTLTLELKII